MKTMSWKQLVLLAGLFSVCDGASWWHKTKCYLHLTECCLDQWHDQHLLRLEHKLNAKLHGQHIVRDVIVPALRGHADFPRKALTMSFHGWTGVGKNYVAQMVAESMFELGMKSKYVRHYLSPHHFPHNDQVSKYKEEIQSTIRSTVGECDRALFIFDEIDKMPPGVIDAVKPYVEYHDNVDKVSYKKAVFIFISNAGSVQLNKVAMEFLQAGKRRETLKLGDVEELVGLEAFNVQGGLQNANIIDKYLIDHFVPFLPLEKVHVKECVWDEFRRKGHDLVDQDIVEEVTDLLPYFPDQSDVYSKTGCKRIHQKVSLIIEKYKNRFRTEL